MSRLFMQAFEPRDKPVFRRKSQKQKREGSAPPVLAQSPTPSPAPGEAPAPAAAAAGAAGAAAAAAKSVTIAVAASPLGSDAGEEHMDALEQIAYNVEQRGRLRDLELTMLKADNERGISDMQRKWGTPEARAKARRELRAQLAREMRRAQIIQEALKAGKTPHFDDEM